MVKQFLDKLGLPQRVEVVSDPGLARLPACNTPEQRDAVLKLRDALATHQRSEDLINLGITSAAQIRSSMQPFDSAPNCSIS